jgi:hypothetical protein
MRFGIRSHSPTSLKLIVLPGCIRLRFAQRLHLRNDKIGDHTSVVLLSFAEKWHRRIIDLRQTDNGMVSLMPDACF